MDKFTFASEKDQRKIEKRFAGPTLSRAHVRTPMIGPTLVLTLRQYLPIELVQIIFNFYLLRIAEDYTSRLRLHNDLAASFENKMKHVICDSTGVLMKNIYPPPMRSIGQVPSCLRPLPFFVSPDAKVKVRIDSIRQYSIRETIFLKNFKSYTEPIQSCLETGEIWVSSVFIVDTDIEGQPYKDVLLSSAIVGDREERLSIFRNWFTTSVLIGFMSG